jgi:gamma-glutamyltranspeptidase/glutathione hydrolase
VGTLVVRALLGLVAARDAAPASAVRTVIACFLLFLLCASSDPAVAAPHTATAAIASAHPLATRAGEEALAAGGNAFDAAVAVSAALAVVEPYGSGLGGGGFWLLHRARDGFEVVVDAREVAPLRASATMYLDAEGRDAALVGAKAAAIPGAPAAMVWIAARYGRLPLGQTLAPAIRLAREGFPVDDRYVELARLRHTVLAQNENAAALFLDAGRVPAAGFRLRQPGLAHTLETLAERGHDGFYDGPVAADLVASVQASGGIWTAEDLRRYRIEERTPQKIRYFDATITTAPLPSAGGLTLAQSLNILRELRFTTLNDITQVHLVVEALRRAYQDRARYLGDPAFVQVPAEQLASEDYAAARAADISIDRATASAELGGESAPARGGSSTTHFSIVDTEGNRVAVTSSLNLPFGGGFVAGATGVLLNDEMDDFTIAPGVPNAYRLVGGRPNAIAPGKRPLSSMSPTFVEDERGVLVLGTPGGSRIVSMVLLAVLDYLHNPHWTLEGMVGAARFHHQFLPDRVEIEPEGFPVAWQTALENRGHVVVVAGRRWGNMQAVHVERASGRAQPASDPRGRIEVMSRF